MSDKYKVTTGQQFFHIETYAKKPSRNSSIQKNKIKQRRGRRSKKDQIKLENHNKRERLADTVSKQRKVRDVLNEVMRITGFCNHVEAPEPPIIIYGMDIPTLGMIVEDVYATAKTLVAKKDGDLAARKIRPDQHVLLAGVASHPRRSVDYKDDPETREMVDFWIDDTINFLEKKYGERLKSVVLHTDEKHVHLHFYCVESMYEQEINGIPTKIFVPVDQGLHDGKTAMKLVEDSGLKGAKKVKYKQEVYSAAMSALQDDFHQNVSSAHGHERNGPRRKRFKTGAEYRSYLADQEKIEQAKFLERKAAEIRKEEKEQLVKSIAGAKNVSKQLDDHVESKKKNIDKEVKIYKNKELEKAEIEISEKKANKEAELQKEFDDLDAKFNEDKVVRKAQIVNELKEFKRIQLVKIKNETKYEKSENTKRLYEFAEKILSVNDDSLIGLRKKSAELIEHQKNHIKSLDMDLKKSNSRARSKGLENNALKKENQRLLNENKVLAMDLSSFKKLYDKTAEKLEFLYEHGMNRYEEVYGNLKNKLRRASEIVFGR